MVLDQLWVNFDVERRVFVTAGKQHVKWGVGKFWNPTDYLHPVPRNPLAVFDERVGTTMVKLHVPWEARGWNAYGVAVLEDIAGLDEPTNRLGRVGVGGRVEAVVGTVELGADALTQDGHRPRFGVDASAGIARRVRGGRAPHEPRRAAVGRREPGRAARLALRARRSGGLHARGGRGRELVREVQRRGHRHARRGVPSTTRATRRRTSTRSSSPARRSHGIPPRR